MQAVNEQDIADLLKAGNGASVVIPDSGGRFSKLSYLWGKLRVDRCDELGNILAPERRGEDGLIPADTAP